MRREAAGYVVGVLVDREPIDTWIIDDTGFLKQGKHSPGVQRQYTGSAGKIANCQIGVSLCVATATEQVPIDFELYLPKAWIDDPVRRERAQIPESITCKTKIDLALDMITRVVENRVPGNAVLADSAYGRSSVFRDTVSILGLDYAVVVEASARVWLLDASDRRRGQVISVEHLGVELGPSAFRRITWRDGIRPNKKLSSRFLFRRSSPRTRTERSRPRGSRCGS